jgi:hypothetical protein
MKITKRTLKTAAKMAAARARVAGAKTMKRMAIATDAALIKAGQAAQAREHKRAGKTALKAAGKIALAAGAAAATVVAARAIARNVKRGAMMPD